MPRDTGHPRMAGGGPFRARPAQQADRTSRAASCAPKGAQNCRQGAPDRLPGRSRFAAGEVGKRCPGVSQLPPRMPGILPRRDMALILRGIALLGSGITDPRAVGPAYLAKLDYRVMVIAIF